MEIECYTKAQWKKLSTDEKQRMFNHALKLMKSTNGDKVRDGLLFLHGNSRNLEPELVKPVIPLLLNFLKPDFITSTELRQFSEWGNENPSVTEEAGTVTDPETGTDIKISITTEISEPPTPPSVLIRKDAIRAIGYLAMKNPDLYSEAIPLIKSLIPIEKHDWIINHAIHALRCLKVDEKIIKKYEKVSNG
jgi:hypothetical protein